MAQYTLNIPDGLAEQIEAAAKEDGVSVSQLCETYIEHALRYRRFQKGLKEISEEEQREEAKSIAEINRLLAIKENSDDALSDESCKRY